MNAGDVAIAIAPELERLLIKLVADTMGKDGETFTLDATYKELGVDSLDRFEILAEAEIQFDVDLPDREYQDVDSLRALATLITRRRRPPLAVVS